MSNRRDRDNCRHPILALGADIKNRFLFAKGKDLYFGPDIDDLGIARNYERFRSKIRRLLKTRGIRPGVVACDLHPAYFSTRFAREEASLFDKNYRLIQVQHHHAHIASVIAEYDIRRPVIGAAFDGTGFGTDGNIWGGEFLLVQGAGFRRLAHFKYRMMPGGEKVVHEPWRMVLSILGEKGAGLIDYVRRCDKELILAMIKKNINSPLSSSAGRLFDAATALLGICRYPSYEAEGPIRLEAMCNDKVSDTYEAEVPEVSIDTDPIFLGMVKDLKAKKDKGYIATKFHNSMAGLIVKVLRRLVKRHGIKDIALSGGVFQNKFLKRRVTEGLSGAGLNIFTNKDAANDLNISMGQYYVSCNSCKG